MLNYLFTFTLKSSISTSVVTLLLLLLTPYLNKRYFMRWKYRIWLILAVYLCLPINYNGIYDYFLSSYRHKILPESIPTVGNTTNAILSTLNTTTFPIGKTSPTAAITNQTLLQQNTLSVSSNTAYPSLLTIFSWIWLLGMIALFLICYFSYFSYHKNIVNNAHLFTKTEYLCEFESLLHTLQISKNITPVIWSDASSPMMIGLFKPYLVLPNENFSIEELHFILKHELIHFKRHDIYGKLLLTAAKTIHWFNPFIYLMCKEAVIDMELSCDEAVIHTGNYDMKKAYAETLFSTLDKQKTSHSLSKSSASYLSTQFYGGANVMKKRFEHILSRNKKRNGLILILLTILLIAGCQATSELKPAMYIEHAQLSKEESSVSPNNNTIAVADMENNSLLKAVEKQKPILDNAILTLNEFIIAYFTEDAENLIPFFADSYDLKRILTYPYGETFADVSELSVGAVHCTIAGASEEFPKWSFLGTSSKIKTEYEYLLINGVDIPIPDYDIEEGYRLIFSISLKPTPYNAIDLDYTEYLTVEMIWQNGEWKIQGYGLEL